MEKTIKPDNSTSWHGLRIALVYAAAGALWIIFSDLAVELTFGRTPGMFWAEVLKGLVFVTSSALLIFYLTNRTIHSIRKSEEALKRSEDIYRALVEGTSDAIFMVDRDRSIISVNQGFVELFGYSREELEGKSIRILHPSDQSYDDFGKTAYPALEKAPLRIEWEMKKKDGTVFPGEGTYSVIRGPNGSTRGHVGIVRDITQRKKAENELEEYREHLEEMVKERTHELEEAQKALVQREKLKTLGAVAAEVAHEIRNPLVSIGGFARRLQRKNPDAHEAEIILQESGRLETMLNRLSEYLRPVEMRPREAYVNTILNESISLLAPELEKEKVAVHLDFQPDLATAHVDPTVLAQIFVVMIRNALQMMNSEKDLTLRTYHGEHSVYVEMISPTAGKKVADPELMLLPFEDKGRAAGFSSTFKLLKGMGGTLSFSRYNGKAVFTVSLVKCRGEHHHADQDASRIG
ncbi:MAG: nitrogen regulation protein NR(II) [Syntrophobacteraceae bacterium]